MNDGGPEHCVSFESVKIRLILMFKELKLDSLIAIRTIPGQSYVNILEKMMSGLNIGFQNVALEQKSPSNEEIKFQNYVVTKPSKTTGRNPSNRLLKCWRNAQLDWL